MAPSVTTDARDGAGARASSGARTGARARAGAGARTGAGHRYNWTITRAGPLIEWSSH